MSVSRTRKVDRQKKRGKDISQTLNRRGDKEELKTFEVAVALQVGAKEKEGKRYRGGGHPRSMHSMVQETWHMENHYLFTSGGVGKKRKGNTFYQQIGLP